MKLSELLNLLKTAETVEEMDVRREEIAALIPALLLSFDYHLVFKIKTILS